jgi:hypothetical protein
MSLEPDRTAPRTPVWNRQPFGQVPFRNGLVDDFETAPDLLRDLVDRSVVKPQLHDLGLKLIGLPAVLEALLNGPAVRAN